MRGACDAAAPIHAGPGSCASLILAALGYSWLVLGGFGWFWVEQRFSAAF